MNEEVSVKQAYLAMYSFLEELYSRYGFDQLGGLLGGMSLLPDGTPADPAMWSDWLQCIERSKSEQIEATVLLRKPMESQRVDVTPPDDGITTSVRQQG